MLASWWHYSPGVVGSDMPRVCILAWKKNSLGIVTVYLMSTRY